MSIDREDPEKSNFRVTHFRFAKEMKAHFVLPRLVFETSLNHHG
jgi:hypothetical protein